MTAPPLRVLMVDPALFTPPYDLALTRGLEHAGVKTRWISRPLRRDEEAEIPVEAVETLYYRGVQDTAKGRGAVWKLRKAISHLLGGLRLLSYARRGGYDVVHFQWAPLPAYDGWIMRRLARRRPVVLTVHDVEPFNGDPTSSLQRLGLARAVSSASRLIVHTESARQTLRDRGVHDDHITVIPHGPLTLAVQSPQDAQYRPAGAPWLIVLFGWLKPYKGLDVLIEAVGLLSREDRQRIRVVIAGEPLMPMEPLLARIAELGLSDIIETRLRRLAETEMAELFARADTFVFPYRQIQASGVLFLVAPYRKWLIASNIGVFTDFITDGLNGERVEPGSAEALAAAIERSIDREPAENSVPAPASWDEIGQLTRNLYEDALEAPRYGRGGRS